MMQTVKTYDSLNRLLKIESTTGGRPVSSHTYGLNQANQRTKRTDADGSYWDYGYDSLGQVTNAVRKWADGTVVAGQQYGYQFDDIGNRKSSGIGVPPVQSGYTANLLNQYESRTVPVSVNILGSAASNATVTVNGTTANRQGEYFRHELALANTNAAAYSSIAIIASMTSGTNNVAVTNTGTAFLPQTPEQFTHDQDGNLIRDGRWQYTWDAENRLLSAEALTNAPAASKRKVEWTYDVNGRRIRQKVYVWDVQSSVFSLQSSVLYVYDGWQCLAEVGTTGSVVRSFTWGLDLSGSQTGAGGIGGLLFGTFNASSSTSSVAYAFDGNGNVSALLDMRTGQVAAEYEYPPFGETIRSTGALAKENPFRFSTKRTDDTTGLVLYEHRILQAPTGRWLSRDPIEERGGRNLYGFVGNNAIGHVDVKGLARLQYSYIVIYVLNPKAEDLWTDNKTVTGLLEKEVEDLLWKLGVNAWRTGTGNSTGEAAEWPHKIVEPHWYGDTTYDLTNLDTKDKWKYVGRAGREKYGKADDVIVFVPGKLGGSWTIGGHEENSHVIGISRIYMMPANASEDERVMALAHEVLHHFLPNFDHDTEGIMTRDIGSATPKLGCATFKALQKKGLKESDVDPNYLIK